MNLKPICLGFVQDKIIDGVCQLCPTNVDIKILSDDLQILDENLAFQWIRRKQEQINDNVHILLDYSRQVFLQTKEKTIFVFHYESLFHLLHSGNLVPFPASILLEDHNPTIQSLLQKNELALKIEKMNPTEEIVTLIVVATNNSYSSPDSLYEEESNEDEDDREQNPLKLSLVQSLASIINIKTIATLNQHPSSLPSPTSYIVCYLCLQTIDENQKLDPNDFFSYSGDCDHSFHKTCLTQIDPLETKYKHSCPICMLTNKK